MAEGIKHAPPNRSYSQGILVIVGLVLFEKQGRTISSFSMSREDAAGWMHFSCQCGMAVSKTVPIVNANPFTLEGDLSMGREAL